jgi:hypothetical protein
MPQINYLYIPSFATLCQYPEIPGSLVPKSPLPNSTLWLICEIDPKKKIRIGGTIIYYLPDYTVGSYNEYPV